MSPSHRSGGHKPHGAPMRPPHRSAGHRPHGPSMNPMRPNMNSARPNRSFFIQAHSYETRPSLKSSAVKTQYRAPWVPTINRNNPPVNKKFSTGRRNFPTVNRKFPTASKKFTTGSIKIHTADMGRKGKAGSSQNNIDDKGYWDSGCSRHMTGNISYLSDFEPFDGRYVSFGQGGCKIQAREPLKPINLSLRMVEENLHVEFLENKAIEKGVGPNWLSDIDSLTKSINYVPVDTGTNSTNFSGTKDVANQEVKKDVSSLRYIVLPNWAHDALLESSSSKSHDESSSKVPEGSGNPNSIASSSNPPADQMDTLTVESPIPTDSLPVPTACLNNSPEPSSKARLILKRVANQEESPSLDNILLLTNRFEDILGVTTSSDEAIGVEANVSNMETTISASPTPTLRIHKDHPKSQIIEPKKVSDALQDPSRVEAMPIGTKWVLKNKKDERGIVVRNKARLVAQGHTQEEGIDYDEVFAPVARIEAIRLFLAYASFMGFTVYQMDVKSAFLYDTIDEEVYVMQPPRFQDLVFLLKVYKVEKAMYGLHQAPRAWYGTLSKYLLINGFQRGTIDQTLFIKRQREYFILVQVYMDDIIFGSSNPQLCREFEALMHEKFQMSAMVIRMARLQFCDYHNMVAILEKGEFNTDFHPMVDFIAASPLRIETTDEGTHILATVDGIQRTVSESSLRRNLKLRDKDGIVSIPDTELFENLTLIG
nr:hypothetical protein [Tanacetum cinerariifolium]